MERAKKLRHHLTDAERLLWSRLRAMQLGAKFRRQHPVAGYYADFCCVERQLIVELDGGQHGEQQQYDEHRTAMLERAGFRVLRFWNNQMLQSTGDVLEAIVDALGQRPSPHPNPLPRRSRGRGGKSIARAPASKTSAASFPAAIAGEKSGGSEERGVAKTSSLSSNNSIVGGEGWGEGEDLASKTPLQRALHLRASLYQLIRRFFAECHVLEVETPILSSAGNTEPNIESFTTRFSGQVDAGARERWLRTSPEFPLKRLLATGVGDCYELGRVFRNGEAGGRHNPEFSMLEWYRVGWDHRRLMEETVALVEAALALVGRRAEVVVTSYRQLFLDGLGLDPLRASIDELRAPLADYGITPDGLTRDDWLDLLITHRLQPLFPRDRITVIHDYPATQCALARVRDGDPPLAERFELYLGPSELANGYHELNDAVEQRARFERDNAVRRARGQPEVPLDTRLLDVLDALPDCAGVAMGIERLLMGLADTDAIADVLAFPFSQA